MINWYWLSIFSLYFFISGILLGTIIRDERFKEIHKHISSIILLLIFILIFPIAFPLFNYLSKDKKVGK
jgi:uncharacterized membrane protein YoaK (UPF0700 family)